MIPKLGFLLVCKLFPRKHWLLLRKNMNEDTSIYLLPKLLNKKNETNTDRFSTENTCSSLFNILSQFFKSLEFFKKWLGCKAKVFRLMMWTTDSAVFLHDLQNWKIKISLIIELRNRPVNKCNFKPIELFVVCLFCFQEMLVNVSLNKNQSNSSYYNIKFKIHSFTDGNQRGGLWAA